MLKEFAHLAAQIHVVTAHSVEIGCAIVLWQVYRDIVIIDAPPAMAASETAELASEVDGVLLDHAYLHFECELDRIIDGFGVNSLIVGRVVAARVAEDAERYFKDLVYDTTIPRNIRLGEAPSFGKPIILYDLRSAGAQSYLSLMREVVKHDKEGTRARA